MFARLTAVILALLALAALPANAREEILSFDSLISVETDGSVIVTETIRVRAEGEQIKRGIYRDLPYNYVGPLGDRRPSGFKLLEVASDVTGRAHFTERRGENIRIYVGERSRRLKRGVYTYTFRYSMTNQVGFFDGYDEIYWNVTGNSWNFPINKVTARVVIPQEARIVQKAAYTGRRGESGKAYSDAVIAGNIVEFHSTRTLAPGEGITVAVGWPKGFVSETSAGDQAMSWLFGNTGLLTLLASTLAVPFYLFRSWLKVGRDPTKGIVIPLFGPPDGLSPAAVSYIHHMRLKSAGRGASTALIAALVSLAVKGKIKLAEVGAHVRADLLTRHGDLPAGEKALLRTLFSGRDRFTFSAAGAAVFARVRRAFRKAIDKEHRGIYFKNNAGHFWAAIALGIAGIAGFLILQSPSQQQLGLFIFAGMASIFIAVFLAVALSQFRQRGIGKYIQLATLAFLGFVFSQVFRTEVDFDVSPAVIVPAAALLVMVLSVVVFAHLLRAPTPVGRKVMDQIEGLRLYLSVAEAERMNMNDAPDMSQQHFEELLPYAIALDVEKPWSQAFQSHLARMVPDNRDPTYRPDWYSGRSWDSHDIGRATEGMVSAMSDSMSDATPSSSGSGSGGGGSSGGGGGGGGGGGW